MVKITADNVLKELYGTDVDTLAKYQKYCLKKKINWFETFLFTEKDWDAFEKYLMKKYKLHKRMKQAIGIVLLNYSGTANKNVLEKNQKIVQRSKLYKEIEKKRWKR